MSRKLKAPSVRRSVTKVSRRARNLERRYLVIPALPVWQDIRTSVTVTRVSGGDSDPDIDVVLAELITIGDYSFLQLQLQIGAGGPGSGTSAYVINGLGGFGFATTNYMAGTGILTDASSGDSYRCSIRSQAGAEFLLIWDGSTGAPLGPAASTGGGPVDLASGDILFDGQVVF